jgi:hypothetical protein
VRIVGVEVNLAGSQRGAQEIPYPAPIRVTRTMLLPITIGITAANAIAARRTIVARPPPNLSRTSRSLKIVVVIDRSSLSPAARKTIPFECISSALACAFQGR